MILDALNSGIAKYIVLNRDVNSAERTYRHFRAVAERSVRDSSSDSSGLSLTAVSGFSDQAHFARVDWYNEKVVEGIMEILDGKEQRTCMEHVLHEPWKQGEWDGTFLYGALSDGPFVYDFIHG